MLRLGVLEDRPPARLDEEQLARAEPPTADGLGRAERDGAGLRGDGDQAIAGHRERGRPEPVAIDERPDPPAVGEDDRGRAVPRREEPGGPAAQRRHVRMRRAAQSASASGMAVSSAGRQLPAGHHQQLEGLVERQRIRAVGRQERAGREQLPGDREVADVARPAADLLAIAADRVDLAVVRDRAERLGEPPDRMRVRRVALVEDRVAERERRPQVRVEVGQPAADARGPCRRSSAPTRTGPTARRAVPPAARAAVSSRRRATTSRRSKASSVERAGVAGPRVRASHDGLGEGRPRRGGRGPERRDVDRHRSPRGRPAGPPRRRSTRRASRARARRSGHAAGTATRSPGRRGRGVAGDQLEERPIERERDAGAVARLAVGPERPAMTQRAETGQRQRQDAIARPAAGVRDEPDAAGVVLVARVVQRAAGAAGTEALDRVHGWSPEKGTDRPPSRGVDGGRSRGRRRQDGGEGPGHPGRVTLDRRPRRGRTGRGRSPRTPG